MVRGSKGSYGCGIVNEVDKTNSRFSIKLKPPCIFKLDAAHIPRKLGIMNPRLALLSSRFPIMIISLCLSYRRILLEKPVFLENAMRL
jgi:hypothetical protein